MEANVLELKRLVTGPTKDGCDNSSMLRKLEARADDLLERLLIAELEMRRSRTLEKKIEAFREFGRVVDRIDMLRRDVEELIHWDAKDSLLVDLDRKVARVMRSPAYRVAEWFQMHANLRWYVGCEAQLNPC